MSTTLQVTNGDLFVNESIGNLVYIQGLGKGNQDVARHLLCALNTYFNEGDELVNLTFNGPGGFTEALATQYIYECINRLIVKQRTAGLDQMVLKVTQVRTRVIGLSTLVFLVEALFNDGSTIAVVDTLTQTPVELDQLLPPAAGR
jgi:hypothetical protein